MNKKIIISVFLISIFCLTIVSALSFKEAFDNVVSKPFNDFITGRGIGDVIQPGISLSGNDQQDQQSDSSPADIQVTCTAWSGIMGGNFPENLLENSWTPSTDDCIKAIDSNPLTKFGGYISKDITPPWWKLKLDFSKPIDKIRLIGGSGFNFCGIIIMPKGGKKIWVMDGACIEDKIQSLGVFTDSITIFWVGTYEGRPTYVKDILIGKKAEKVCINDDITNVLTKNTVEDESGNIKEDSCVASYYTTGLTTRYMLVDYCKLGILLTGGYGAASCSVDEAICDENKNIKIERIICPAYAPSCYDGRCVKICTDNMDCDPGYECNLVEQARKIKICEPFALTSEECMGCVSNNICYPIGTRKVNEYCDVNAQGDYIWSTQKSEGNGCVNYWECKPNLICLDTKCTKFTTAGAPAPAECMGCEITVGQKTKCLPPGTRRAGTYCGLKADNTYDMITQIAQNAVDIRCENDYECKSNICVQGKCAEPMVETGFLKKIWCKITNPLSSMVCEANPDSDYCKCISE